MSLHARRLLTAALVAAGAAPAAGGAADAQLSVDQARAFRAWMVRIVDTQIARGPTPRWQGRDCAGLVRFAVAEALRPHDLAWRRANGIGGRVPPELELSAPQQALRHSWRLADGRRAAYVGALELVQENARFVGKDVNLAQPGDLLFFDQGDDQHLMVWTGWYVAYHTGASDRPGHPDDPRCRPATARPATRVIRMSCRDNGLRAVSVRDLMAWRDTRWQPAADNPNFLGVYRLRFLPR